MKGSCGPRKNAMYFHRSCILIALIGYDVNCSVVTVHGVGDVLEHPAGTYLLW